MKTYILVILFALSVVASPVFATGNKKINYKVSNPKPAIQTFKASTDTKKKSTYNKGYGEISKETGVVKTKHVQGYSKENGTYVGDYYRSR